MGREYKLCGECGARLDPGERCDCTDEVSCRTCYYFTEEGHCTANKSYIREEYRDKVYLRKHLRCYDTK